MSEYWVSKKKYFCKYCEIYIADDAPSRQHHENGLRHKGNVERFIRGIYKAGVKQKNDREEEKREMKRVEQAAAAAFAQDIGAGIAKPPTAVASSSSSTTAKNPPPKPSNLYANYSTAASLGYTDPDADRLAEEMRIRQSQGVAGDWEMVTTAVQPAGLSSSPTARQSDTTTGADTTGRAEGVKREAEGLSAEDVRAFKLRKKQLTAGLGEIYDPGLIPITVKKKAEPPLPGPSSSVATESKPEPQDSSGEGAVTMEAEVETHLSKTTSTDPSSKWTKAKWSAPIPDIPLADRTSIFGFKPQEPGVTVNQTSEVREPGVKSEEPEVKVEEDVNLPRDLVPNDGGDTGSIKFKKRRAPMNAGRGRREI